MKKVLLKSSARLAPFVAAMVFAAIALGIFAVFVERYFNSKEIDFLIEGADKRNLSYELIIHNPFTNDYSFRILED